MDGSPGRPTAAITCGCGCSTCPAPCPLAVTRCRSASCVPTGEPADVALGVDILGAAYLGGSPLSPYVLAGRIDELTPGSVARLERGLRTASAPWATTGF